MSLQASPRAASVNTTCVNTAHGYASVPVHPTMGQRSTGLSRARSCRETAHRVEACVGDHLCSAAFKSTLKVLLRFTSRVPS